jgi:hypothetical protein
MHKMMVRCSSGRIESGTGNTVMCNGFGAKKLGDREDGSPLDRTAAIPFEMRQKGE